MAGRIVVSWQTPRRVLRALHYGKLRYGREAPAGAPEEAVGAGAGHSEGMVGALGIVSLLLMILPLAGCSQGEPREIEARLSVAEALGDAGGQGYARAVEVRELAFPADHGPHPDFRTEWWYFTGNLAGADGRRFGYQLTFFRSAVVPPGAKPRQIDEVEGRASRWATRQVYMAHFAVTDVEGARFVAAERFSRGALGLAGARAEPFRVWVESWTAEAAAPDRTPPTALPPFADPFASSREDGLFPLRLTAETDSASLDLLLTAGKGRVLQGDRGLSRKGPQAGNASYYYSYPRMPTTGTLALGGETFRLEGASWLDREWSTSVLGPDQAGWDWFALQLDDGREVVAYRLRAAGEEGGGPLAYAALVPERPDEAAPGRLRVLDLDGARLEVTDRWTSPASGAVYPAGWRLRLPAANLVLDVEPLLADQELDLAVRYWEGAVAVRGAAGGRPVAGRGYAELTGYGEAAGRVR